MNNVKIGASVPIRGSKIIQAVADFILKIIRWEIKGEIPDLKKFIIIVAPHTSNWDFVLGILVMFSLRIHIRWMGKHTIFRKPFGGLMKWLGGIPVNRTYAAGVISEIADSFTNNESLIINLAPEGTRKKVKNWKLGFYFIAKKANIPVLIGCIDYKKKVISFGPVIHLTDDQEKDITKIKSFYNSDMAKYPEKF